MSKGKVEMKALILNSGMGSRMGDITKMHSKCMTEISGTETILSHQLRLLHTAGIRDVVITTGPFNEELMQYCLSLGLDFNYQFVNNPLYKSTNYIYSIYLARMYLDEDILLMHGDLVFEDKVLNSVINFPASCMTVSTTLPLPEKDFKAVVTNNRIKKIGINYFENAYAAQPLYKLLKEDWKSWLKRIEHYCEENRRSCYAENAFNEISEECHLFMLDVKNMLCNEIDTLNDLELIRKRMEGEI